MRKYLPGLFAIAVAMTFSIFAGAKQQQGPNFALRWFKYLGDLGGDGIYNPYNYQVKQIQLPECAGTSSNVCEIYVQSDGGSPELPVLSPYEPSQVRYFQFQ